MVMQKRIIFKAQIMIANNKRLNHSPMRERAIVLMREALELLEEAGEDLAAYHLQWAHDIAIPGGRQYSGPAVRRRCPRQGLGDRHYLDPHPAYLAVVIDLYSRRVVGWSIQSRQTTDAVLQALHMAVWRRKPDPFGSGLAVHQHGLGGLHPGSQS